MATDCIFKEEVVVHVSINLALNGVLHGHGCIWFANFQSEPP